MPEYETANIFPPAPVVSARLFGPRGAAGTEVLLLIDTGADVSVLPLQAAYSVGAEAQPAQRPVQFYSGQEATYLQADMTVAFLRYRFRGPYLLADSPYGILGRNILNLLRITRDGPALFWSA